MSLDTSNAGERRARRDESPALSMDSTQGAASCGLGPATSEALARIDTELRDYRAEEARRLGIEETAEHWHDDSEPVFTKDDRQSTTLLFGGLTKAHDALLEAVLQSLGYKAKALPEADISAMQVGKEFGNRGQCNPTYFTVGNLVQRLIKLRDEDNVSSEDIVDNYAFVTFGACGPCRFGTYVTEYRKALRDSGFTGFRVLALSQEGPQDDLSNAGIDTNFKFYLRLLKSLFAADILNVLGYRTRPYELEKGATDAVIQESIKILQDAILKNRSTLLALRRCRKLFAGIKVDRMQAKPKVGIIGEFWAMTTEGDGNYRLQRFLEEEGAECEIQIITAWALYIVWCIGYDIRESTMLGRVKGETDRYEGLAPRKGLLFVGLAMRAVKLIFNSFARAAGLKNYKLPDMDDVAKLAHEYYPAQLRGGEGHMEVGKVIQTAVHKKAHMIVSVKPFGCMPSAGVSDGVQSLVAARHPEIEFLPIETTGDSAVNAYSRIQMALFKARNKARAEYEKALADAGIDAETAAARARGDKKLSNALHYPAHEVTGTAANAVYELG